ncbi:MAG: carbon-nitrogen hydrolase family protein [Chloroflexi bacterium]|nr:carbon-nitrogen hydrolase family protein [Chloroflexota bacterium]
MRVNLVAVQAKPDLKDYAWPEAFSAKMASLMAQAMGAVDGGLPTLVSFPELVAMYLTFVPYYWDDLKGGGKLESAAMQIVMNHLGRVPEAERTNPERAARYLLFVEHALEAEKAYIDTFSGLAREYGAYVAAGSIALPPIEREPSKGGRHLMDATKVYNIAYLFSPRGVPLRRVPKVNLTEPFEARVFDAGPRSELIPVDTLLGRIGTLVCWDGFHESLVEHYDAMGVDILLKPSYNQHLWGGPCSYDAPGTEGENWLRTGCPSIIQGRDNIRYGVNAMMVGAVFEDMLAEGLSSISRNTSRSGASWEEGIIAMAERPDAEEIVAAAVDIDGR